MNNRSTTPEKDVMFVGTTAYADLVYVADKNAYILINNINYFKSTGGPLISNGYAHFRTNFLRKNKLSFEAFTQVQYDEGRKMTSRFLVGAGVRYLMIKSRKSRIHVGSGAMQEQEVWRPFDEDQDIEKNMLKLTSYLGGTVFFSDEVKFHIMAYYQTGYDTDDSVYRHRLSGDTKLSIGLTDRLDFTVSFNFQYEDKPIIPINGFVYSLNNGLKWSF